MPLLLPRFSSTSYLPYAVLAFYSLHALSFPCACSSWPLLSVQNFRFQSVSNRECVSTNLLCFLALSFVSLLDCPDL